jgi:hypothetical protein
MLRWVRIELLLFALLKEERSFRQAYHNRWCTKFCEIVWGLRATDTYFLSVFIKPRQKTFVMHFAVTCFQKLKKEKEWREEIFAARIIFSDETAFQLSVYFNRRNVRVWGINNPSAAIENTRDGPKLQCSFSVSKQTCSSLTFFTDRCLNGVVCHVWWRKCQLWHRNFFIIHYRRSHTYIYDLPPC